MGRVMAMIPTWNEAENIEPLVKEILALGEDYEALVVDDDSPDGTWRIVEEMRRSDPRVHLLHRKRDRGRGAAGIAGFREAIRLGADWVIEMDADFSHPPKYIPEFMKRTPEADLVIGSRRVLGGGERGRSPVRGWITRMAGWFIRRVLGVPVGDPTSGFRLFSRRALEAMPWDAMRARGPEIVQEVLWAAHLGGFRLVEVPILFEERRAGRSTFTAKIMLRSLIAVLRMRLRRSKLAPRQGESQEIR
jgi:dolichol-phosphate mannosyltransferase